MRYVPKSETCDLVMERLLRVVMESTEVVPTDILPLVKVLREVCRSVPLSERVPANRLVVEAVMKDEYTVEEEYGNDREEVVAEIPTDGCVQAS